MDGWGRIKQQVNPQHVYPNNNNNNPIFIIFKPLPQRMQQTTPITWLNKPQKHDYPAAYSYLCLHYKEAEAKKLTEKLKKAPMSYFKAKDIFRASALSLLGVSNYHVESNLQKIKNHSKLSPILLVRNPTLQRIIIADGYHRLCAVYGLNEDALIPCKIV